MGTDAEDAGAALRLCGVVGALLTVFAVLGVYLTAPEEGGGAVAWLVSLAAFAVGALLLFVAATGWAVSLGVRASREPVRDGAVRAD
ncbi:hypothetical protein AB0N29_14210 [Nocardioides sp. NPDC092400]|uniref:hypothetical protein n=1 Tax=Nocardioides sp. NPDC092400 TaxID=3155196 RepID=UPI00342648B9